MIQLMKKRGDAKPGQEKSRIPWRGTDVRKGYAPGFDDELDTVDYSEIEDDYAPASLASTGPNWNDDAEGYGDPRHGRPAAAPRPATPPVAPPRQEMVPATPGDQGAR